MWPCWPSLGAEVPPQPPARMEVTVRPPSRDPVSPGAPAPSHKSRSQADYDFSSLGRAWGWVCPLCYPGTEGALAASLWEPRGCCAWRGSERCPKPPQHRDHHPPKQCSQHPSETKLGAEGGCKAPCALVGFKWGCPVLQRRLALVSKHPHPQTPELPQFPSARTTKPHSRGRGLAVRREF